MTKIDQKDFSGGLTAISFNGIPFKEDPNAPPGQMLFINENTMEFRRIDRRTRWQRVKDWFKRLVK